MQCFVCDKHLGFVGQPPGGFIYEDEYWLLCHFPANQSVPGRVVLESKRHFLDFSDMTVEEATSYGLVVQRLYKAMKQVTGALRVYQLVLLEGVPHFHVHFFPRLGDSSLLGMDFLNHQFTCDEEVAAQTAKRLAESLK